MTGINKYDYKERRARRRENHKNLDLRRKRKDRFVTDESIQRDWKRYEDEIDE